MKYDELVKSLRELQAIGAECDGHYCGDCPNRTLCNKYSNGDLSKIYGRAADAIEELRNICNAEAEGRLIVLPCKVGDTVYEPTNRGTISEYRIHAFRVELFDSIWAEWDIISGFVYRNINGFCWGGEYSPGTDDYDDCGCYIKGDIRDSCRLLPPIRFLLGWGKRKKARYYFNHQYDDFESWYTDRCEKEEKLKEAFSEYLSVMGYGIVYKYQDGTVVPINGEYKALDEYRDFYRLMDDCEDIFIPIKFEPLKYRWKKILKDTWLRFLSVLKPYFLE